MAAVIRSREISLCLFLQALSQLKAIYKEHAETIIGNMDSLIFLGGREHTTIKELSESLGKETISMQTESRTRGQSESYGQNTQRLGKELMSPDELTTMDGRMCILQLRGLRPFLSPKYELTKHPNYKYTTEADKRNSFDTGTLINTKLKLLPDDVYSVYNLTVPDETPIDDLNDTDTPDDAILNFDDMDDPESYA
jgi:type IV secretion system protein VirD4